MNEQVKKQNACWLATLVLLIIPISGISIDIYTPSLPAVAKYFNTSQTLAQLSISTYLIGLGVTQLFAGSVSDSFGRKKPFIVGMNLFIITTFMIPWVSNINQLLILRFIQGVSVSFTVVPMRSVILDLFEGRELSKMVSYMTMSWSIGPIIAPAIGGYLQFYFGWKASFNILGLYSLICFFLLLLYLPETSQFYHSFKLKDVLRRYYSILFHKKYFLGVMLNGMIYSIIILFSIMGPFLIQGVLHFNSVHFGHIALLMGLAWFLGTFLSRFLIDVDLNKKAKFCLCSMLGVSLVMLLLSIIYPLNIYNIVIPTWFILIIGGALFPSYFARCVSLFSQMTGSANALYGSLVFFIASINSMLGALLESTSEVPLAMAYVVIISTCLIIFYFDK